MFPDLKERFDVFNEIAKLLDVLHLQAIAEFHRQFSSRSHFARTATLMNRDFHRMLPMAISSLDLPRRIRGQALTKKLVQPRILIRGNSPTIRHSLLVR